jgi:hypothetical protein
MLLQKPKKINKNDIKHKKDDPLPHIQTILKSKNTVISPEENTDDKTQTLSNNTETKLKTKTV